MYRKEVSSFVQWCEMNYLNLNVKKTKELIIDFRKKKSIIEPIVIDNEAVEIVDSYKYLGCVIDKDLNGTIHVSKIAKRANQRMYFVRKLKQNWCE